MRPIKHLHPIWHNQDQNMNHSIIINIINSMEWGKRVHLLSSSNTMRTCEKIFTLLASSIASLISTHTVSWSQTWRINLLNSMIKCIFHLPFPLCGVACVPWSRLICRSGEKTGGSDCGATLKTSRSLWKDKRLYVGSYWMAWGSQGTNGGGQCLMWGYSHGIWELSGDRLHNMLLFQQAEVKLESN